MDTKQALRQSIDMGEFIAMGYLQDLTDDEMMHRPAKQANHIKWQLGHLISSEHSLVDKIAPGRMPPLPDGFEERYKRSQAASDNPEDFDDKASLLKVYQQQRAGTLKVLDDLKDKDFDQPTGLDYCPTVGACFSMQGNHYTMHAGQWAIIRRQLGRPPLY